uniref:Uncharacterized protein n=1 Tax=Nicotiana sylvestris TaxID=4096 RepID=A0A1U7Y8Y4_NICSY|nr:PREDICTED: putative protein TPRXL [Nicotiana sylvestris]
MSSPYVVIISPPLGPVIDTVMINDDGKASDDGASLNRRRHSSSTQQNSQSVELVTPTEGDVSPLWGTTSYPSTPSASSPSSPAPATTTSLPSSSTLLTATATSSPPVTSDHEGDVPPSQSLVYRNLGQNYATPSEDPSRRRNITLSVSIGCNLISRQVELANYLKTLASEKD